MKRYVIIIIVSTIILLSISSFFLLPTQKSTTPKIEVFQLGKNVYRYIEAANACESVGATLATKKDIIRAVKLGANWDNIGWVRGIQAYFPLQENNRIGKKGLNGGKMASQLKLAATCVGYKPPKSNPISKQMSIMPWSKDKWSQFN